MARAGSTSAFRTLPGFLEPLHGALLTQCIPEAVDTAVRPAQRDGGGLVLTVEHGDFDAAYEAARDLVHARRFARPLLLDAARYAGPERRDGRAPFDVAWLRRQRALGLPVLTDSGYIGERADEALESVLGRAQLVDDVIALLPLHLSWLRDPLPRNMLIAHVRDTGIPVALAIEHDGDPYAVPGVIEGVREVLSVGVPVMVLRAGVSGLGALTAGAFAAGIGATPRLRGLTAGAGVADTELAHLLDLRDELFRPGLTRSQRLGMWRDWCVTTLYREPEVGDPPAPALRRWAEVLPHVTPGWSARLHGG